MDPCGENREWKRDTPPHPMGPGLGLWDQWVLGQVFANARLFKKP